MGLTRPPTAAALSSVVAVSVWLSERLTAAVAISAGFTGCTGRRHSTARRRRGLVAARLSAGSKSSETREVASVFIGNNRNYKREGQNGGHQQFPVAPEYKVISWVAHAAFPFSVTQRICFAERGYSNPTC
jgi:hypothetical protein